MATAVKRLLPILVLSVSFILGLGPTTAAYAIDVQVQIEDTEGTVIPARVHVRTDGNLPWPGYPDSTLLAHGNMGSFFYTSGNFEMSIPPGWTTITVGKGFEYRPVHMIPNLTTDSSLVITLERVFDMRSEGWHSGDVHIHTQHEPVDYPVSPEQMHMVGQAEDLAISWCLDQEFEFTGGPHDVSTPDHIIYYTTEYRNNALGHVSLQGLKEIIGFSCCWVPEPAYPMLSDTYEGWAPQWDEAMVLSHPQTDSDIWENGGWPASGFARETPVLAAEGYVDAYDIASYSNEPDVYLVEWYRLLNLGLQIPASAGTDCGLARYWDKPPGGYRVYVKLDQTVNDPSLWVEALKGGQTFVSNFPLIPRFEVDGVVAGDVLHISEPTTVDVSFRVESVLGLQSARIIRNGQLASYIPLPSDPDGTVVDTTVQVQVPEPSWLALRVDGTTDHPHVESTNLFAHTGAVYVQMDSIPVHKTAPAGRFIEWLDSLVVFVDDIRDNWQSDEQRQEVLGRIAAAEQFYADYFVLPPGPFDLLSPVEGETLGVGPVLLDWEDAIDPEEGDAIIYRGDVSPDSSFGLGWSLPVVTESEVIADFPYTPDKVYWWRILAGDRNGNWTPSTPEKSWFYIGPVSSVDGTRAEIDEPLIRLWPNPASDRVWFSVGGTGTDPFEVEVIDVTGRRVLQRHVPGAGNSGTRKAGPSLFVWDGRDREGRLVPSGHYWIRLLGTGSFGSRPRVAPVLLLR